MESTAKYIVPVIGGPLDGAVLYLTESPSYVFLVPRRPHNSPVERPEPDFLEDQKRDHVYLLQPSPARYIYEHIARS